jgi:hypothetical protein
MATNIEITNIRPTSKPGTVKAFCTLKLGGVTVNDCKIVQQDGQRAWLAMPDRAYDGSDGKKRYSPYVELSDSLKALVSDAVQKHVPAARIAEPEATHGDDNIPF